MPDDHQLQDLRPTGVLKWQEQTIWKANGTWAASMAVRRACRSLRTEAQRSRASFATSGDRNSQRTRRVLNTSTGKIGAMIRLVIRNSDSPFRRRAIRARTPKSGSANRWLMSASLRKRPNCCDAAKCREVPMADMQVQTLIKPSTSERSLGTPCRCLERLDERLRGERLYKKCDAFRGRRGFANGRVLIPGNVDNRHGNACGFETMSQLDP